jgi:ATP-dependent RNA helicase DeaD
MGKLPALNQTLILSATMPPAIEVIARKYLKDPAVVKLEVADQTPSEISHYYVRTPLEQRFNTLVNLIRSEAPERGIIFTRMKHETKKLAAQLREQAGIEAGFLNGNMSQNARNTMLARFRAGEFQFLIATDVAARGLHVDGLSHVFHYAVPTVVETYIHRSGRTGRAGAEGKTITFVTPDAEADFRAIQKRITLTPLTTSGAEAPAPAGRTGAAPARTRAAEAPVREITWRKFKVAVPQAHRQTNEGCRVWLANTAGVDDSTIRAVAIFPNHVTVEVASHVADRLVNSLRRVMA